MPNLPITSSNSQPSTNVANMSQPNGAPGSQSAEPFGAVLARQIDGASAPSSVAPSPEKIGIDAKSTTDPKSPAGNGEQDKALALAGIPNDPSVALVAMLQLPQEIKTPVVTDTTSNPATTVREMATGKAGANQPALNIGAAQANAKIDMAGTPFGKTDAAITFADNPLLLAPSNQEMVKSTVLPDSLPGAAQSAQLISQSAASLAASGITPNMLTNNKTADSVQTIASPLGSSGWSEEFSQKISWMSTQQNQVAELHLNPPDLGPLDVVLKISDNQATALFTSPHSSVRDAIENAMPRLREILADSGITLGNATVSDQTPRDGNSPGFANQRANSQRGQELAAGNADSSVPSLSTMQLTPARRHHGMVDTFA